MNLFIKKKQDYQQVIYMKVRLLKTGSKIRIY